MIGNTAIRATSLCKLTLGALLLLPAIGIAQDTCVEMGGLAWDSWWKTDAGGPGTLPAGVQNKDYIRCKACHGWDGLGTDGGYARRSRKDTRPNAGFGDGDQTSRSVRDGAVTTEMIGHEGTGRSYADGTGSFVAIDICFFIVLCE